MSQLAALALVAVIVTRSTWLSRRRARTAQPGVAVDLEFDPQTIEARR